MALLYIEEIQYILHFYVFLNELSIKLNSWKYPDRFKIWSIGIGQLPNSTMRM